VSGKLSLLYELLLSILHSIIPSEDAHQSEYVAASDKRREWISGLVPVFLFLYYPSNPCTALQEAPDKR
jgi:hypothetical protein